VNSAIAKAAGIHAVRIEHPKDVRAGLEDALNHPGPALVDLVTGRMLEMARSNLCKIPGAQLLR